MNLLLVVCDVFFVRFLEEIEDTKKTLRNYLTFKIFQNMFFFNNTAQNPAIVPCSRTALCKAFLFGLAIEDARALRCSSNSGRSPDCALRVNLQ